MNNDVRKREGEKRKRVTKLKKKKKKHGRVMETQHELVDSLPAITVNHEERRLARSLASK